MASCSKNEISIVYESRKPKAPVVFKSLIVVGIPPHIQRREANFEEILGRYEFQKKLALFQYNEQDVARGLVWEESEDTADSEDEEKPTRGSDLMMELVMCKRVFMGVLLLRNCAANVTGFWVGGNIDPDEFLPYDYLNLANCVSTRGVSFPYMKKLCKEGDFGIVAFIPRYHDWYLMDVNWSMLRDVIFSMPCTPCAGKVFFNAMAHFVRPGEPGTALVNHCNPALFHQLQEMPCLYMVLFREQASV